MKKRQEGSAMIIVMCVMVITVALALSLLLISSVMVMNATRGNQKEQCRITAVSISEVLVEEIKKFEYTEYPGEVQEGLKGKLQTVLTPEWRAYDKYGENEGDYFTYELSGTKLPGETVLKLYWLDESEEGLKELDSNNPKDAAASFQNVVLYVEVTNTVGEESATIISSFHPVVNTKKVENADSIVSIVLEKWFWEYDGHQWERGDS